MGDAIERVAPAAMVPKAREVLGRMASTAEVLNERVEVLPLETPEDEALAADFIREIRRLISEGEDARKEIVTPIKRQVREVDGVFRKPRKALETVLGRLRDRLSEAQTARREAQEKARREALEAAQGGDLEAANAAIVSAPAEVETEGVSTRWDWYVDGWDPATVPREFLTLDTAKVKAEIRSALDGEREPAIPGVTFKRKAIPIVRGRS